MRKISDDLPLKVEQKDIEPENGIVDWLKGQAAQGGYTYLLAHALDGVIWGRIEDGKLLTIHDFVDEVGTKEAQEITPLLADDTLMEARLFGENAELHVWQEGQKWSGCWKRDIDRDQATYVESYDELQMLWGDQAQPIGQSGFTLMQHGTQGLRHVVPLVTNRSDYDGTPPLRLQLRHYLNNEDEARVVLSRLVALREENA